MKKAFVIILSVVTLFTISACKGAEQTPLDMTADEMESKILDLESQVADLESQLGNIESAVNIPDGTVKTSYEELIAICKDVFEQTVETDLECVEDPDFGVPSDIDKTGFISATWRTNDSDTEPSYFVTIWYDAVSIINKLKDSFLYNHLNNLGAEKNIEIYWNTSNNQETRTLLYEQILGWYGVLY